MNEEDSHRIHELCSRIAVEQNRQKFLALVEELNEILSAQDARLRGKLAGGPEKRDEP